jgi:proline dehydrogenase
MTDGHLVRQARPGRDSLIAALDRISVAREAVTPFVPGETVASAVSAVTEAMDAGMSASLMFLPPPNVPGASLLSYMQVIEALDADSLTDGTDLTVDLAELGLDGPGSVDHVLSETAALCGAATAVGMTVTFAGVAHGLVDDALMIHSELVASYPSTGVTLAAALHRTEADCFDVAALGARVRLIKRESSEAVGVAFTKPADVDKAYVRCLRILLSGRSHAIIATHDHRLIDIGGALAIRSDRAQGEYEFQFRRGVAGDTAAELLAAGESVSQLIPYGPDWANYMATRITLNPAAVGQVARAAVNRGAGQ